MQGHTDRATINQRRPMSKAMREVLRDIIRYGRISGKTFSQSDQGRLRALMDRGYITPDPAQWWTATEAGIEADKANG